jgi:hypothetical protein
VGRPMVSALKPRRGGFLRPFGCGWFIREFLLGRGPSGSPTIDTSVGAPQAEIFHHYKLAIIEATSLDRATRAEEKNARREKRPINPDNIEELAGEYLSHMPYKSRGCRYHSFVVYFHNLIRLGWVESTGKVEPSAFQQHYPKGQPRRYYRLTDRGRGADDDEWANPLTALYGH